jgi:transcriptional regulator with XRE-family HTH domain
VLYALGNLIRARRISRGLTQADLAAVIGVGYTTVKYYERGFYEPPIETMLRIAQACDMPLSTFISPLDTFEVPLREVREQITRTRKKPDANP